VRRVIDAFVAYGLPEPFIEITQGGMAVTVFNGLTKATSDNPREGVNGGVNALLAFLQTNPGKRASELVQPLNASLRTIERWLKQLKDQDKIEFRGASKTGGYYVKAQE
jgi:ATP-dependent DNA helicase RecG